MANPMPTDPAAPMTARDRARKHVTAYIDELMRSGAAQGKTELLLAHVERALTEHTAALTAALEAAGEKADAEMLRVKACEHIALGDEGWQKLRNECPSTAAVAFLRDALEAAERRLVSLQLEMRLMSGDLQGAMVREGQATTARLAAERRVGEAVAAEREACALIAGNEREAAETVIALELIPAARREAQSWRDGVRAVENAIRARATPAGQGEDQ